MRTFEAAVIGGGMLGAAIAYGLQARGVRTGLLDEGDVAFRAARGNFGLVWVQSKGDGSPDYAAWTRMSSDLWSEFADKLKTNTDVDVGHTRPGGFHLCYSEDEVRDREDKMRRLHNQAGGAFRFDMLDHKELAKSLPGLGPEVVGGSYCPLDGHANPLYLLRALHAGFLKAGGGHMPGARVSNLEAKGDGFHMETASGPVQAGKVILAAGLGNKDLGAKVGLDVPVHPVRGQILVTEKLKPFMEHPTTYVRQTVEGGMLLGDSHEDVGFDAGTTSAMISEIAGRATRAFPFLKDVKLVRTWGALRVMTPDGCPIYAQSEAHPGAFAAACHSGVTLAAVHAGPLAEAIADGGLPPSVASLNTERFHVH